MGKIICDICGTSYPDTAEQCPICGCTKEAAAEMLGEDFLTEEAQMSADKVERTGSRKKKEIFDFDEVNSEIEDSEEPEESVDDDEEEGEEKETNTFAVILLTILIVLLLIAAGFLFVRYIRPNLKEKVTDKPEQTQQVEVTQVPTVSIGVPCETLVLTSGSETVLNEAGQKFLLHVSALPSDTTDLITFVSEDESVATVTADGRVEAIAEGETTITISCGSKSIPFKVTVRYEEAVVAPADGETAAPGESAEQAPAVSGNLKDVKLKLKRTDISLGMGYTFQLVLDCKLEQNEVEWSSEHPHIATVDANGNVTALKRGGTTSVTAKYGDQTVSCIVRCN